MSVAASVTRALVSEVKELERLSEQLFEETPALAERCREFTADRGLCRGPLKAMLWDQHRIPPLVDSRAMWSANMKQPDYDSAKPISRPLFRNRDDCITHSERGEVICKCPATGSERTMAFQAFEAGRSTLKYRCPAAAAGFECLGRDACHKGAGCRAGAFGRVVRIDLENHSHHIFSPTRQDSPSWRRGSNRRSALERIYIRLDNGFRFECHTIRGKAKMTARVGLALAVMLALEMMRASFPGMLCCRDSVFSFARQRKTGSLQHISHRNISLALGLPWARRKQQMRSPVGAVPICDTG